MAKSCHCHSSVDDLGAGVEAGLSRRAPIFGVRAFPFRWDGPVLIGRTAIGRTTIRVLQVRFPPDLSWNVDGAGSSVVLNAHQIVEESLRDQIGVASIFQDAIRIREGEDGKAIRPVQASDGRLQGLGALGVPVAGDQDDLVVLASLPHDRVRGVSG